MANNPLANIIISAEDKTQAAFASLKRNLKDVESTASSVGAIFGRFIPAFTAAAVIGFGKNVIDAADNMNDLKDATGESVERIAAWRLVTEQSGTSLETLSRGLFLASKNLVSNGAELAKYGITATTAEEAIFQLADVISSLPADAPERASIAFALLGKTSESLMPLLSQGGDALRRMVEEGSKGAKAFAELAPQADKFNDELAELKEKASIGGASLFLPLVRGANDWVDAAEKISDGTFEAADAFTYLSGPVGTAFRNWLLDVNGISLEVGTSLSELAKRSEKLSRDYAGLNSLLAVQKQRLEDSRRAAQADDFKKNVDALKGQISGLQDLGKGLQTAFIAAGSAADEALQKSKDFLQSARDIRQSGQDRITDIQLKDALPDDADGVRNRQILDALDKAKSARIQADYQTLLGNTKEADRQLDIAEKQAKHADDITGKLNDQDLAQQRITEAVEEQASVEESRAKVQDKIAEQETARQDAQRAAMKENEESIADLTARLETLNAKVQELTNADQTIKLAVDEQAYNDTLAKIEKLRAEYEALHRVNILPGATGVTDSQGNAVFTDGFAFGGAISGPGSGTSDSILARLSNGEHVLTAREVEAAGGHDAIYAIRRALLRGDFSQFADGGAVSRIRLPSIDSLPSPGRGGMDRGTFVIGGERVEVFSESENFDLLRKAALMHGGLK